MSQKYRDIVVWMIKYSKYIGFCWYKRLNEIVPFTQLSLAFLNVISGDHEPAPGSPSFVRSSVESIPGYSRPKNEPLISAVLGETALPLRSAVESIPSVL